MANQPPERPIRPQPTSGFPSPAAESAEASLDVRELLVKRPAATFYLRMRGDGQAAAGVFAGDVLVVDRSLAPRAGQLVIVATEGELRVARWQPQAAQTAQVDRADDVGAWPATMLWGVVTYVIHRADALGGETAADALDIE